MNVAPAHLWFPDRVGSYVDEVAGLAELYGRPLDDWQLVAIDAMTSYKAGGLPAAFEVCVTVPRQQGKSAGVLLPIIMAELFLFDADEMTWSAHLFKTARKAFADFRALIGNTPELAKRVRQISASHGDEGIYLKSGGSLEFVARGGGSGRGLGGKRVVMDEALILSSESMASLLPTLTARRDAQVLYGTSGGLVGSDQARSLRDRGRRGGDPELAYAEWCADEPGQCGVDDCDHVFGAKNCILDDEDRWHRANPSPRVPMERIGQMRRALGHTPEKFATEFLGFWQDPAMELGRMDLDAWHVCATDAGPVGEVVFAIEVGLSSASASIVACGAGGDGLPIFELVESGRGASWVPKVLRKLIDARRPLAPVALDPAGPAGSLIPALTEAGVEFAAMSGRDTTSACEAFAAGVNDKQLHYHADPRLEAAALGARRRHVGDGAWKWSRRDSEVDITSLQAATWAAWTWAQFAGADYDIANSIF